LVGENIQIIVLSNYQADHRRYVIQNTQFLSFEDLKEKVKETDGLKFTLCVLRDLLTSMEVNIIERGKSYMLVANTESTITKKLKVVVN